MSNNWPLTPLGEVLTERQEVPNLLDLELGAVPIISKISFDSGRIEFRSEGETKTNMILIRPGDLVISGINAAKGAIAIYNPNSNTPAAATIHYGAYSVDEERADRSFLWWILRSHSFRELLNQHVPGGIKTELKAKRLLPVPVPIPSLAEQRRIVAKIERLAANIAQATGYRQSLVTEADALFLSGLDQLLRALAARLPSRSLLSLSDPARGISYGIVQTGNPVDDGIPTLRAGDLARFHVITSNVKRVDAQIEAKYRRTRLRGNELLLRIRGGLGEVAVCPEEMVGGNVSREIAVIPLLPGAMTEYAMYAVAAPSSQDFLQRHLRGTSYVGINLKDVRRLDIPVPQYTDQRRIVAYLDDLRTKVDRLKALQAQAQAELDALLPSILDRAFKGELWR